MSTPDRMPHELAVCEWIESVLGHTVIFASQDAPRQSRPYVTVQILPGILRARPQQTLTDTPDGDDFVEFTDTPILFTCSATIYSQDCRAEAFELVASISSSDSQELFAGFEADGVTRDGRILRAIAGVTVETAERDTQNEPFAVVDLEGTFVHTRQSTAGAIKTIELTDNTE